MISVEWIYHYIRQDKQQGGSLYKHLRQGHKKRRCKYGRGKTPPIPDRVSIHHRPSEVEKKQQIGHWEGDLVVCSKGREVLITLVERVSKFTLMAKAPSKQAISVARTMKKMIFPYRKAFQSITLDNGGEFYQYQKVKKKFRIDFYFADPYSSWQRGLNENTNGLIRQFIPKKTPLESFSDKQIYDIQKNINKRPRKDLNYKNPLNIFANFVSQKIALAT